MLPFPSAFDKMIGLSVFHLKDDTSLGFCRRLVGRNITLAANFECPTAPKEFFHRFLNVFDAIGINDWIDC